MGCLTAKASGEIASFMSPSVTNIKSLKVHFSPKQLGTGDPSLENVREIDNQTITIKLDNGDTTEDYSQYIDDFFVYSTDSETPHDDTDAIQAALDASLEVYFPPGVYMVSSTLNIPNKAHIWGNAGDSKIRAANTFNGSFIAQVAVYDSSGLPQATRFCIEKLEFSCNNVSVGGLYLVRPYNSCIVRDILITNCPKTAIWVGDTRLNSNNTAYILTTSQSRSQSLLIENCYCDASSSIAPLELVDY